jgi:protein-S-isoprenylcysteine O-methyltransferase Ste14
MGFVPVTLVTILFISQIIIGIYLLPEVTQIDIIAYFGIGIYFFSGLIFGWLPIIEFRKKGQVKRGKSYIHTTKIVDTGIYSIVRHPQYVTFMLWSIAGMLLFQNWIVFFLGIPIFPLTYLDLIKADENAIKKFGDEYKIYIKEVPRANFLLGMVRKLKNGKNKEVKTDF